MQIALTQEQVQDALGLYVQRVYIDTGQVKPSYRVDRVRINTRSIPTVTLVDVLLEDGAQVEPLTEPEAQDDTLSGKKNHEDSHYHPDISHKMLDRISRVIHHDYYNPKDEDLRVAIIQYARNSGIRDVRSNMSIRVIRNKFIQSKAVQPSPIKVTCGNPFTHLTAQPMKE